MMSETKEEKSDDNTEGKDDEKEINIDDTINDNNIFDGSNNIKKIKAIDVHKLGILKPDPNIWKRELIVDNNFNMLLKFSKYLVCSKFSRIHICI